MRAWCKIKKKRRSPWNDKTDSQSYNGQQGDNGSKIKEEGLAGVGIRMSSKKWNGLGQSIQRGRIQIY